MIGDAVQGMMLGGALGDAAGGEIEFDAIEQIRARFGAEGLTDLPGSVDHPALITDDTQMSLWTLEGLIRAHRIASTRPNPDWDGAALPIAVAAVHAAYLRWLVTQTGGKPATALDGWLLAQQGLHHQRAPGHTCLTALASTGAPGAEPGSVTHALNDSKGCGAVMRAAPIALWPAREVESVFRLAVHTGALTHSHPSGYLSAGVLAVLVRSLLDGADLDESLDAALVIVAQWSHHEEVTGLLALARTAARRARPLSPEDLARELGGGWVGEEALAIGVYAALRAEGFAEAVLLAVNHSGDSDSTGAICGNLVGARCGRAALPASWLDRLELVPVIEQLTQDALSLLAGEGPIEDPALLSRYPIAPAA